MSDSSKSALSLISTHKGYSESEQRIVDYILEHQSEHRQTAISGIFSFCLILILFLDLVVR